MLMTYRNVIAATIAVTVYIVAGSSAMAQRHGGFGGGGFRSGGFSGGGFRGGSGPARVMPGLARSGSRFGSGIPRNFHADRDRHRGGRFHNRFVFFGDFGDPFYYYPYGYADGYYSSGYYPYDYGYDSYDQPAYQGSPAHAASLIGQVQLRLARAGYYRGEIDGVSGNATRSAIRRYERAHGLPVDGQIRGRLLTNMGMG
jgi:Putative peptidoglycan binding domain